MICDLKPALHHEPTLPVRSLTQYELGHPLTVLLCVLRAPGSILLLTDRDDPIEILNALLERHTRVPGHVIQVPIVPTPRTLRVSLFRRPPRRIDAHAGEVHFSLTSRFINVLDFFF
jgi:hypothetical protein